MKTDNKQNLQEQMKTDLIELIKRDEAKAIREKGKMIYYVTTTGDVYSYNKNNKNIKKLKPYVIKNYYLVRTINNKDERVHRLVAEAFIKDFEPHLHINHIDKNTFFNHLSNIEVCTNKQNQYHRAITNRIDWNDISISEIEAHSQHLKTNDINKVVQSLDFSRIMTTFLNDTPSIYEVHDITEKEVTQSC